jgi:hypothetical protein
MSVGKSVWTENDIIQFKGQEESLRLEFKSGALLDKPESAWVADLSKQVSAFANTEGGILVLGLREEKSGKRRIAADPDGVTDQLSRDQLQRKLEGNVFPYLSGIRINCVPISSLAGRVVFVLEIPAGTTAYQANDGRYYGRSELEVKYLPDHEIRVRMVRGKVARACLSLRLRSVTLSSEQQTEMRKRHADAIELFASDAEAAVKRYPEAFLDLMKMRFVPDILRFDLVIRNDGELTIREPAVEFSQFWSSDVFGNVRRDSRATQVDMPGEVIYPGDERILPSSTREFSCKPGEPVMPGDFIVRWKVFLDNAPPSMGELDLGHFLQTERDKAASVSSEIGG